MEVLLIMIHTRGPQPIPPRSLFRDPGSTPFPLANFRGKTQRVNMKL